MRNFRIVPLTKEYAAHIRASRTDEFGQPVLELPANGYGPCRVSLLPFVPGKDRRLLLKYSPFSIDNAFNQPGPVFISSSEVEPYMEIYQFPPAIKKDRENFPLTLIGYSQEQVMVFSKLVGDLDVDDLIEEIFNSQPSVQYLHARNAEAGCFICRIDRLN